MAKPVEKDRIKAVFSIAPNHVFSPVRGLLTCATVILTHIINDMDKTVTRPVSLLLVARPGRMREGLQALLRTIPEIEIVGQADFESQTLPLISQQQPALVLLDSSLAFREMLPALIQIKGEYPRTRCIVLVENAQQQSAAREAGADTTLITGFSAEVLHAAIDQVLMRISNSSESDEEVQHG
jgi:DNA-binding NarL/FixJ family response regulator